MEELTPQQCEELRAHLESLAADLRAVLETSEDGARPVALDEPIGRVSRMDAIQQQRMVQASRRAAELRLKQVAAALQRLTQASYGSCLSCGENVGFARLQVRPEATLCITCQSQRESGS